MRVLISQWARNAAHNLDDRRNAWVASRSATSFTAKQLAKLRISDKLDHSEVLTYGANDLSKLYTDAVNDIGLLQAHLAELNGTKRIDGVRYSPEVFKVYRASVIAHLGYVQLIATTAKATKRRFQWENAFRDGADTVGSMTHAEMVSRSVDMFKRYGRKWRGKEWFSEMDEEDQQFVENIVDWLRREATQTTL